MSYLISLPCLSWPMLPRSVKSGLTSTEPRKIKKVAVLQYSDLFWCGRGDSNLWPLESENYDAAHNSMIYSNFLLVLHHSGTLITSNIKQCVNDKN